MSSLLKFDQEWKNIFVAGLGGGAIHGIVQPLLKNALANFGGNTAIAGMQLSDIALILLGKFGADKTKGMMSTALKGMAIIGVYDALYTNFLSGMIGNLGTSLGAATTSAGASETVANLSGSLREFRKTQPYYVTP